MNIVFDLSVTDELRSRYTVLQLDTFYFPHAGKNCTAFCILDNIPISEMTSMDKTIELHNNLLKNYKIQNWKFCEDALEHLQGKWNNELDTFYQDLKSRIAEHKVSNLDSEWTGIITKTNINA